MQAFLQLLHKVTCTNTTTIWISFSLPTGYFLQGAGPALVGACIAFQAAGKLQLATKGELVDIRPRCTGGLIGTRVAGQLGRPPIEAASEHIHRSLYSIGLPLFMPTEETEQHKPDNVTGEWVPVVQLTMASFVDNIVAIAPSPKNAIQPVKEFEAELQDKWNQKTKPTSREIVVAKGGA